MDKEKSDLWGAMFDSPGLNKFGIEYKRFLFLRDLLVEVRSCLGKVFRLPKKEQKLLTNLAVSAEKVGELLKDW